MTITEALKLANAAPKDAPPFNVSLVCGFTPLHLRILLGAQLQRAVADRRVCIHTGLYGDIAGTLEGLSNQPLEAAALLLEWSDLDPRLGYRSAGRWAASLTPDILKTVGGILKRLTGALDRIPSGLRVAVSLPTLPLPPVFHTPACQASEAEIALRLLISDFSSSIALLRGIFIVNEAELLERSPWATRYDFKSDLLTGLPYTLGHADGLASAIATLLAPRAPKKGLITDLDDTLWRGLVGETGSQDVHWDLAGHGQIHGLYQNLLASLSTQGVLIGIASKNNAEIVEETFRRSDILLRPERVFPFEVHWEPKSGSITRILKAWNIAADSVVFVDDSPLELAEVEAQHPGIECVLFPKDDYPAAYSMLRRLRDLFGKERITGDDAIRLDSIRQGSAFQQAAEEGSGNIPDIFLREVNATVTFEPAAIEDARALELVNKTNQFNLNGRRYTATDWTRQLSYPAAVSMVVNYEDKFGPLGKIAVIVGRFDRDVLTVHTWVMSCRAFARRIEHQCLQALFDLGVQQIDFDFARTPRNGPVCDCFEMYLERQPESPFTLRREQFEQHCPPLYHTVVGQPRIVLSHA